MSVKRLIRAFWLRVRTLAVRAEGRFFDARRGIETSPSSNFKLTRLGSDSGCLEYLPSRPRSAGILLRRLPIGDLGDYTFLDLGSGKGRMLFVAAEYPFRRVEGVEFALELHRRAEDNISRYHARKRKCPRIESTHANALDYRFPDENLVVYLFNPFTAEVMTPVLANLENTPDDRDIWVVLYWPDLSSVFRTRERWRLIESATRYCIYRRIARHVLASSGA